MATNRLQAATAEAEAEGAATAGAPAAAGSGGGIKAWLPLIANVILMPVLAFAMTKFVLLPGLQSGGSGHAATAEADSHSGGKGAHGKDAKAKVNAPLAGKVLVNVAGTGGTRFLIASLTLVSAKEELKHEIEKNDPQLRDVAAGILAAKTIQDLEKPGARNLIRAELITAFNNVFGHQLITDIYITEFAIQ